MANIVQPVSIAMTAEIWRYVFDSLEDPVFLHDAQFRVLLANHAYYREAGRVDEIVGEGGYAGCRDGVHVLGTKLCELKTLGRNQEALAGLSELIVLVEALREQLKALVQESRQWAKPGLEPL